MSKPTAITWTEEKRNALRAALKAHTGSGVFTLKLDPEGEAEFVPGYAKHLLEYLDGQFKRPTPAARPANEGESSYTTGSGSWEGDGEF